MDLALAAGGAFLSAFLQVAFDRIASSRKLIEFIQGKNDVQFDQETLDRLEITLVSLSVVLEDAEAKQAKSPLVGKWLDKLKDAMYHADDLLDELNTECLRLKLHDFQPSDADLAFNSHFIQELMPDLNNITARLENFVKQSHLLGLQKFDTKEKGGARRVELRNKKCIENLTLKWSGFAECSQDELNIFSILEPHTNIKQLSIKGYRGTSFPDWLGDSSFTNMEFLSLKDCKNCFVLPIFGKLPSLKKLHICSMDGISEVLYGNSIGVNHLEELYVSWCPSLVSVPTHVDNLEIKDCPSLSLSLQSSLIKSLTIVECIHLEYPTSDSCNSCLESLRIMRCGDFIKAIPLFSFNKLEHLCIKKWETPKLFEFPNGCHQSLTALKILEIRNCNNILSFPEGGLPAPNLKDLRVARCKKLKSLPEQMHTQLPSLRFLHIYGCPEIECFPEGGLPSSLRSLHIKDCEKLMICQANWASLSHLDYLEISSCEKMKILEKSWGLQRLSSLRGLSIGDFDNKLFPDEGLLPSSLNDLYIHECPNLESLNQKGLQHLCSLQSLQIWNCRNLRYLPEEKLSSSLSHLEISACENLESFPVGLTSSLSTLDIYCCPKLEARMEREKGEDWPKVSHIPFISVNFKLIS